MKVKGYTILTSGGGWDAALANLETMVGEYITAGWEPLGKPVRVDGSYWYQAMIRREDNYPPNTGPR